MAFDKLKGMMQGNPVDESATKQAEQRVAETPKNPNGDLTSMFLPQGQPQGQAPAQPPMQASPPPPAQMPPPQVPQAPQGQMAPMGPPTPNTLGVLQSMQQPAQPGPADAPPQKQLTPQEELFLSKLKLGGLSIGQNSKL